MSLTGAREKVEVTPEKLECLVRGAYELYRNNRKRVLPNWEELSEEVQGIWRLAVAVRCMQRLEEIERTAWVKEMMKGKSAEVSYTERVF